MSNKLSSTWLMQQMFSAQYAWNLFPKCWPLALQSAGTSIAGLVSYSTSRTIKTPLVHGSAAPCAMTLSIKMRWKPCSSTRATTTRWVRRLLFILWYAPRATLSSVTRHFQGVNLHFQMHLLRNRLSSCTQVSSLNRMRSSTVRHGWWWVTDKRCGRS